MSAFAFNKPVIVSNLGGLPEMLGIGKYGILVKPSDVEALAGAMDQLLNTPDLLQSFSNNIENDYGKASTFGIILTRSTRRFISKCI